MITVTNEKEVVKVKIELAIGFTTVFNQNRGNEMDAILLKNQINKDLSNLISTIREQAYKDGWKDKASKKNKKKTWFNSNINSIYIGH